MKKHFEIVIAETTPKALYKKSVENIRLTQIQNKANLEAELDYGKRYIGSCMPTKERISYLKETALNYQNSKVEYLL